MLIREMTVSDIDEVISLDQEIFTKPYIKEDWLYELNNNVYSIVKVIIKDERIVGYIDYWVAYERVELARIGIAKDYQRQGLGTFLMDIMLDSLNDEVENITLEVRTSNVSAINLYEKHGFIKVGIRKNYYENHEDAILMVLERGQQ